MDYNKLHDEALANASKSHNALDSAIKCSSVSGGKSKDPMSSYEKKQDEDVMRSALAALFEDLVSKSSNSIARDWRADFRMVESVHYYYYTYYSSNPILLIIFGILAFFTATSHFYLFAGIFTLLAISMLAGSNPRMFFKLQTTHIRVDRKFKDVVFENIFKNQMSLKNVIILSSFFTAFSFIFLKWQFAIFGFDFHIFLLGYNPNLELYGLFNAVACFVVAYAKLKERWA